MAPTASAAAAENNPIITCLPRHLAYSNHVDLNGAWSAEGWVMYLSADRGHVAFVAMDGADEPVARLGHGNTHVFWGTVHNSLISGAWVDLPRGGRDNAYPLRVTFRVSRQPNGQAQLVQVSSQGNNYGIASFQPCRDPSAPGDDGNPY
ncbi:MAG TPA: hypothetical protein VFH54_11770 [Mycobacteriales bacterium]|nr:hypothetical protein [Mycobacteriales bacterium]